MSCKPYIWGVEYDGSGTTVQGGEGICFPLEDQHHSLRLRYAHVDSSGTEGSGSPARERERREQGFKLHPSTSAQELEVAPKLLPEQNVSREHASVTGQTNH